MFDSSGTPTPTDSHLLFDEETVAQLVRRYSAVPASAQPLLLQIAAGPPEAKQRGWLEDAFAALPSAARAEFRTRLLDAGRLSQTISELALGTLLQAQGQSITFAPDLAGRTPDVVAEDAAGRRTVFEVWTRCIPAKTLAQGQAWARLAGMVEQIPRPVGLVVDSVYDGRAQPPSAQQMGQIRRQLRAWLLSTRTEVGDAIEIAGFVFYALTGMPGLRARLLPVVPHTTADSNLVKDMIEEKLARYRRVVSAVQLPFVVVIAAEPSSGLDIALVRGTLTGQNMASMSFSAGTFGSMDMPPMKLRMNDDPPRFDPALSAVGWLEAGSGHDARLTLWPMPTAALSLPPIESPSISVEVISQET